MAKSRVSSLYCVISHSSQPRNITKQTKKAYQANLQEIPWYELVCWWCGRGGWQNHSPLSPDVGPGFHPVGGRFSSGRGGNLPGGAQAIRLNLYPPGRSCLWACQGIFTYWSTLQKSSYLSLERRDMRNNWVIAISSDIKIKSVFIPSVFLQITYLKV